MGGHLTIEEKNAWKESVLESRLDDFISLKDWLKAEKIEFENHGYFIIVKNMIIEFDLKVAFSAGKRGFQMIVRVQDILAYLNVETGDIIRK